MTLKKKINEIGKEMTNDALKAAALTAQSKVIDAVRIFALKVLNNPNVSPREGLSDSEYADIIIAELQLLIDADQKIKEGLRTELKCAMLNVYANRQKIERYEKALRRIRDQSLERFADQIARQALGERRE